MASNILRSVPFLIATWSGKIALKATVGNFWFFRHL